MGTTKRSRWRAYAATGVIAVGGSLTAGMITEAADAAQPFLACNADALRASQRYWFFGNQAGIDFGASGTTATAIDSDAPAPNPPEGTTVITDRDGQLLFWSDGQRVFNRNQQVMPNGSGLLAAPSATQTVAAFPALGHPGVYFVVSNGGAAESGGAGPLRWNVVDMSLDGGLGDVTSKNNLLAGGDIATEGMTAVPNADGTGFWVISSTADSPNVVAWQFDGDGPVDGPVASPMSTNNGHTFGTMNFSADLSQLVQMTSVVGGGQIRLLDFDAATGVVTERFTWSVPTGAGTGTTGYSADFSPSGRYVYATKIFGGSHLYRYDTAGAATAADIKATEVDLGVVGTNGGQVHRGPDGRMYVATNGTNTLGTVNDPDNATDPDFVPNGFVLATGTASIWGLSQTITGCSPPPIDLDASADVTTASVGDTINYSFTVHNGGADAVTAAEVAASLPGLSAIGCDTTSIAGGADATCTATYVVTVADYDAGSVTLNATASAIPDGGTGADRVSSDQDTVVVTIVDTEPPVVTVDGPTDGGTYTEGGTPPADYSCTDLDLASCTAVDEDGNPINPGDPIPSMPGTHTITVVGIDESGNRTEKTVTYTVVAAPPACPEDGLQVLEPPVSNIQLGENTHVNIDGNGLASGTVHSTVEPLLDQVVDPLTVPLLGLDSQDLVHEVNCQIVEPVEDVVDAITIPLVNEVKTVVKNLLQGLRLW